MYVCVRVRLCQYIYIYIYILYQILTDDSYLLHLNNNWNILMNNWFNL